MHHHRHHPSSGISCTSPITINTLSAAACDECNATKTTLLLQTKGMDDSINDTVIVDTEGLTGLTQNNNTTAYISSPDSNMTRLSSPSTTPTTPISPVSATFAGMDSINMNQDVKHSNSDVVSKTVDSKGDSKGDSKKAKESKKTRSRASSTSQRAHTRSPSSSTAGTSTKRPRHGTHRRTISSQQLPPLTTSGLQSRGSTSSGNNNNSSMSPQKRDQLIALHRDSCRLFQDLSSSNNNANNYHTNIVSSIDPLVLDQEETNLIRSTFVSPTASPILISQRSHSFSPGFISSGMDDHDVSDEDLLPSSSTTDRPRYHRGTTAATTSHIQSEGISSVPENLEESHIFDDQQQVPAAAVMEWTSPSTRRREYEKIDRSNKKIRRIWRRITPSFLHSGDTPTPFFEEGKKNTHEGSVRRFRMDIPDEDDVADYHSEKGEGGNMKILKSGINLLSGPKVEKSKWSCF